MHFEVAADEIAAGKREPARLEMVLEDARARHRSGGEHDGAGLVCRAVRASDADDGVRVARRRHQRGDRVAGDQRKVRQLADVVDEVPFRVRFVA